MSYSSSDNASDQSGFCKLGSDLVISFNGSLLECIPQCRSSCVGTVLTRKGELVSRTSRRANWEPLSTPSVYLFYDNDTNATFSVDTCRCKIREIQPCGRILDCTDRVIYEIKCGNWVPICDLSNRQHRTIVLVNTVPATATSASFEFPGINPVVDSFSEIFTDQVVFLGNTATVTFRPSGPGSLPAGGAVALSFTVCYGCEEVTVVKIFIRLPGAGARFSAQGGAIAPITTPLATPLTALVLPGIADSLGGLILPSLAAGATARAFAIAPWALEIYDRPAPGIFDPITGIATVSVAAAGDMLVNSQLSYSSPAPIANVGAAITGTGTGTIVTGVTFRTAVPYFALLRNEVIIDVAPVTANLQLVSFANLGIPPPPYAVTDAPSILAALGVILPPGAIAVIVANAIGTAIINASFAGVNFYDLNEIGVATISIGLTTVPGDRLRLVYVDPLAVFTGTPGTGVALPTLPAVPVVATAPGYRLIPLGTTFNGTQLI